MALSQVSRDWCKPSASSQAPFRPSARLRSASVRLRWVRRSWAGHRPAHGSLVRRAPTGPPWEALSTTAQTNPPVIAGSLTTRLRMRVTVHRRYNGSVDKISKKNKKVAGAFIEPLSLREAAKNKQQKNTHAHTRLSALFLGLLGWAGTRKAKPIWISLKQETVSGSGISWAMQVCTSLQTDNHASTPPLRRNNRRRQFENYC